MMGIAKKVVIGMALTTGMDALCRAEMAIGERTTLRFASAAMGRRSLTRRDAFVKRLSPFDRSARMKSEDVVCETEFLEFVGSNVLDWSESERRSVERSMESILPRLESLGLAWPPSILFVKTTGAEEGGAAYTRGNVICLPRGRLKSSPEKLQKIICHELFHILSRANPRVRERLYAAIGFSACRELIFPEELRARKITNPDAPRNDHWIRLRVAGERCAAMPVLYARAEKYSSKRGGTIFDYLTFRFLIVEHDPETGTVKPSREGGRLRLVDVEEVAGFFEQVGRNTQYIIHPEEILADNFALMLLEEQDLPSPEIVSRMADILSNARLDP